MNKLFLQKLNERKNAFQLIDLSIDDKKHNPKDEEEQGKADEVSDDSSEQDFEPVDKTRFKGNEFAKYLQYVTASD